MSRKLYQKVAPHLKRVTYDGGVATNNINDLLLLQRSNEELKDYIKVAFCPELYGNKFRQDVSNAAIKYLSKGYSANSIQREFGENIVVNGDFSNGANGWTVNGSAIIDGGKVTYSTISDRIFRSIGFLNAGDIVIITYKVISTNNNPLYTNGGGGSFSNVIQLPTNLGYNVVKMPVTISGPANLLLGTNAGNFIGSITEITVSKVLSNDLTQIADNSQPYLDKIAPTERLSLKNPNGGIRYLAHPTVSFGANDEWTVETILNMNGGGNQWYAGSSVKTLIGLFWDTSRASFRNESGNLAAGTINTSTSKYNGKNIVVTYVAKGNGVLSVYVNGLLFDTINAATNVNFNVLGGVDPAIAIKGQIHSHHIFSKALSPTQVLERASILRSIFPEIPFTRIGEQIWSVRNYEAVVTPQGTLIPEVQSNGNVEKVVNGGFDTDTAWIKGAAQMSIAGGKCIFNGVSNSSVFQTFTISSGKWYKFTFTIDSISQGTVSARIAGDKSGIGRTTTGTYIEYIQAGSSATGLGIIGNNSAIATIDNVSVQEIGWSGSQELYDGIYARTAEAASSVEKITNGNFNTDLSNWTIGTNWSWLSGRAKCISATEGGYNTLGQQILSTGKYYKISFKYEVISGALQCTQGTTAISGQLTGSGTYNGYFLSSSNTINFGRFFTDSGYEFYIDDVSVRELGLSDATSINNYTYAAVKAAAMWCHYGNSVVNGAIYGKLYNWFAVKLLQMDIDYYKRDTGIDWGWRVPTQADFNTLADTLGGASVAGGKMKVPGTAYWNSPNTGADNSSGFSAIGGGRRYEEGNFEQEKSHYRVFTISEIIGNNDVQWMAINTEGIILATYNLSKKWGGALRLIKS